ncbi:metallophosphoesterase [Jonesia quinghaiensis]|uniref:metallophosphoesterase n=1 Tax=Jonesia quinghaiensis TaxID=262806 RepID=UPI00056AA33E|nr:metallophosphoesterase [Jonesia quinghaiensis]
MQGVAALGAAGLAVLAYARIEAEMFTVRRFTLPVLPAGSQPVRVLHISDLHMTPGQTRKTRWVQQLASLEPDLVIDTGDNMAHRHAMPVVLDALDPLMDIPGVFVMGSNDYFAPRMKNPARYLLSDPAKRYVPPADRLPADQLGSAMASRGWLDLTNTRAHLEINDVQIEFVGVDDPHINRDRYPTPAPKDSGTVRLGITHAPYQRTLNAMHSDQCDAIIAGHTHGGQLCLPGFGALVTNCDLDRARAKGVSGWPGARPDQPGGQDSAWLHVCAGLGTSPYTPVRVACRPEAVLLTLTATTA